MSQTPGPQQHADAAPVHFDYRSAAQQAGLSSDDLGRLIREFRTDYPDDPMLQELHVLRACHAIARGTTTIAEILRPSRDSRAA